MWWIEYKYQQNIFFAQTRDVTYSLIILLFLSIKLYFILIAEKLFFKSK